MPQGVIRKIVAGKGFGFVTRDDGDKDVFLHVSAMPPGTIFDDALIERRVSFDVEKSEKGPRAVNVQLIGW